MVLIGINVLLLLVVVFVGRNSLRQQELILKQRQLISLQKELTSIQEENISLQDEIIQILSK